MDGQFAGAMSWASQYAEGTIGNSAVGRLITLDEVVELEAEHAWIHNFGDIYQGYWIEQDSNGKNLVDSDSIDTITGEALDNLTFGYRPVIEISKSLVEPVS